MSRTLNERFVAIEQILWWEDRLTSNHLMALFAIGRQQASRDLAAYLQQHHDNCYYDTKLKGYRPSTSFTAYYSSLAFNEYLALRPQQSSPRTLTNISTLLPWPVRHQHCTQSQHNLRLLTRAIRQQQCIEVCYRSLNHPQGTKRHIHPKHLVFTGLRWHVRAYCEQRQAFRDFVIGRFVHVAAQGKKSRLSLADDHDWQRQLTVHFVANPTLSDAAQQLIHADYQLDAHGLQLTTSAALLNYLLRQYPVAVNLAQATQQPQQFPLLLANASQLTPYLWGAQES